MRLPQVANVTLGQVCASGLVVLEVACHSCPRRGRYRVTRLIDQDGAGKQLVQSAGLPRRQLLEAPRVVA